MDIQKRNLHNTDARNTDDPVSDMAGISKRNLTKEQQVSVPERLFPVTVRS